MYSTKYISLIFLFLARLSNAQNVDTSTGKPILTLVCDSRVICTMKVRALWQELFRELQVAIGNYEEKDGSQNLSSLELFYDSHPFSYSANPPWMTVTITAAPQYAIQPACVQSCLYWSNSVVDEAFNLIDDLGCDAYTLPLS
jgi:hypothetical protein